MAGNLAEERRSGTALTALEEIIQLQRLMARKLADVSSVTTQIAQALQWKDQVSVRLLLAERSDPIRALLEIQNRIDSRLLACPEAEAIHMKALLDGAPADSSEEEVLCQMVGQNRRALQKVQEVDRAISLQMGGKRSYYRKFRESDGSRDTRSRR